MVNSNETDDFFSEQLRLPLDPEKMDEARDEFERHSNNVAGCNAYINRLCLDRSISWLPEFIAKDIRPDVDLFTCWEFLNGTPIVCQQTRVVLVPYEIPQNQPFRIPREWVDILRFAADYYLIYGVYLDGEESWICPKGYVSHSQLKRYGQYDPEQRGYYTELKRLTTEEDILMLLAALEFGPRTPKGEISPLPALAPQRAEALLRKLGNPDILFPRLEIPFAEWAALLANDERRRKLYELRNSRSAAAKPASLLENLVRAGWQTAEEFFETLAAQRQGLALDFRVKSGASSPKSIPALVELLHTDQHKVKVMQAIDLLGQIAAGKPEAIAALTEIATSTAEDREIRRAAAVSLGKIDSENPNSAVCIGKFIDLGTQTSGLSVALMMTLMPEANGKTNVQVRVYPTGSESCLPANLQLLVLEESGEVFLEATSRSADNWIQLEFSAESGDRCSVEVILGSASFSEEFTF